MFVVIVIGVFGIVDGVFVIYGFVCRWLWLWLWFLLLLLLLSLLLSLMWEIVCLLLLFDCYRCLQKKQCDFY